MEIYKNKHVWLILILLLAFNLNLTPHKDYQYPVHVDEWENFAVSQAILDSGNVVYIEPFMGEKTITNDLEIGLRTFLAVFKSVTGMSWLLIFRYMPSIIFMFTILGVYIFANRDGYGLQAAFLAALIPTSVRLIGPGFLVAVGVGLMFIPLSIFVAYNTKKYQLLFIFITFLFLIHPPTALAVIAVLIPFVLLNYRGNPKHSVFIFIAVALMFVFLISSPRLMHLVAPTAGSMVSVTKHFLPLAPQVFKVYGGIQTLIFIIGFFMLGIRGERKDQSLIFASVLLLLPITIYAQFTVGNLTIYDRSYSYLMILMSIIGGFGLLSISTALNKHRFGQAIYVLLAISILSTAAIAHSNTPYYHVVDEQEYGDYLWIKENLVDVEGISVLEPWKAKAYVPITGRYVYSHIPLGPSEFCEKRNREIDEFFRDGGNNSTFLDENNISIVYTKSTITNPDLTEVKPRIYLYATK
jgi:hypothetical protein